jgi:hypothetical protein
MSRRAKEYLMAGLSQKLTDLARSPKAQQALTKAREAAAKPENKAKIDRLRAKLTGGRPGA